MLDEITKEKFIKRWVWSIDLIDGKWVVFINDHFNGSLCHRGATEDEAVENAYNALKAAAAYNVDFSNKVYDL